MLVRLVLYRVASRLWSCRGLQWADAPASDIPHGFLRGRFHPRFMEPRTLRRLLAVGGIVAPILFTVVVAILSLMRPGYSQVSDFVSDLGVGPNAAIQNANFVVVGLLVIALALALVRSLPAPRSKTLDAGVVLMTVFGLGVLLAGVFPEDYAGGGLHTGVSATAFLASILAPILVGWGLRTAHPGWHRYATYSLVSGILAFGVLIVFKIAVGGPYQGAAQRAFLAVPWIWVGATGIQVYARNGGLKVVAKASELPGR